tara:strand:+ start:883 stop:984 length:102 start_codon:yes stop_codon:yes gene_type:complete
MPVTTEKKPNLIMGKRILQQEIDEEEISSPEPF